MNFASPNRAQRGALILSLLTIVLAVVPTFGQTSRGTISGILRDQSGAFVSGAKVTITEVATNVSRQTLTNDAGLYRFDAVMLGGHTLKVEAAGFAIASVQNITVSANRTSSIDVKLMPGATMETVTVEAAAEQLQTSEQTRLETITAREVADLPVLGQNSLNLMLTAAGVITTDQGGSTNSGIGSVNGARPRSNSFLIDGVENNDISVNGPAAIPTNQDAIQEVSVQTSNFSSEFGRAGGAVVNQITKSGTNQLHGTVAWIYRTQNFNAWDRDERNSDEQGVFLRHTPAFTVGGPLIIPGLYNGKDRTFFFGGAQWDRLNAGSGLSAPFRAPTAAGITTLQTLATAGCTQAQTYLDWLDGFVAPATNVTNINLAIPATTFAATGSCNASDRTGMTMETGVGSRAVPSSYYDNNHTLRFDHRLTDKQQLSVRWLYDASQNPNGGAIAISSFGDADFTARIMTGALAHSYTISPNVTNEFRFNYGRTAFNFPLSSSSPLTQTLPTMVLGSGLASIGASSSFPQGRTANTWQYQDVVTLVRGRHQMRMGADFLRQLARQTAPANIRGTITYATTTGMTAFSNFLDDFSGTSANPVALSFGTPTYRPNLFRQAYFFQDAWKVKDNLTVNLGLRYENFGQPANIFRFPVVTTTAADFGVPSQVDHDNNNFGPGVGFSWTPRILQRIFGEEKSVIRAGFQVTYDTFFNNLLSNIAGGNPNLVSNVPATVVVNAANPRGLANVSSAFGSLTPAPLNPLTGAGSQFSKNIVNPYTMRYSLGWQRELPGKMLMDLSYVGSLSRKQFRSAQLNPLLPNATNTAPRAATTTDSGRLDPTIGARTPRISNASANYNSLQIGVKRGFSNTPLGGITFNSNYTWAKSLDIISEVFATNPNPGTQGSSQRVILTQPKLDYGPSDFDVRHTWVSTAVWDIRGPKHGWLGQAFGGWSLSYVIPIQSGSPFDVTDGFDRDFDGGTADRPDVGNPHAPFNSRALAVLPSTCSTGFINVDSAACVTANDVRFISWGAVDFGGTQGLRNDPNANTLHRNAVRTPGSVLVHMNILKTFKITEQLKLEYRAEIFNLANHENLNYTPQGFTVGTSLANVMAGTVPNFLDYEAGRLLGALPTNSRKIQMGLKILF